jgi:hypothetical protein
MVLHIESDESLEGQHLSLLQISSVFLRNVWNFLCSFNVNSTFFFLGGGGGTRSPNFSYHKIEMKEKKGFKFYF